MARLVFTESVVQEAQEGVDELSPLLLRWAAAPGEPGEALRHQIECAAGGVPEEDRARVLGPLSPTADDDQVRTALGVLLLAKTLADLGWAVKHEPLIEEKTPDLLIQRGSVEYVVEVRRVLGRAHDRGRAYLALQTALYGMKTRTPLHVLALSISGGASLKPVVEHIDQVLAGPAPAGRRQFQSAGVFISYEVIDLGEGTTCFPALFGQQLGTISGNDAGLVEAAINEKLRAYKLPIVVATDLIGVVGGFGDVVHAFYGERPIVVPVRLDGRAPRAEPRLGPAMNGMLVGRGRNAERARQRLVAVLPFTLARTDGPFSVRVQLLGNPATRPAPAFDEFAPIPRCVLLKEQEDGVALMGWGPEGSHPPSGWIHVP